MNAICVTEVSIEFIGKQPSFENGDVEPRTRRSIAAAFPTKIDACSQVAKRSFLYRDRVVNMGLSQEGSKSCTFFFLNFPISSCI